jgi:hypothetical protein
MKKLPALNSLIVLHHEEGAVMFRVKAYEGTTEVGVIDATIEDRFPKQMIKWLDRSSCLVPTVGQLKAFTGSAA